MTDKKRKLTRPRNRKNAFPVYVQELANFFGLDVSLVRIVYTFATVFTAFAGVIIYIILLIIIPEESNRYYRKC